MGKSKRMDRLSRDAIAAEQAGMSYGAWKAKNPHTPDEDDDEPDLVAASPVTTRTCAQCGQEFEYNPRTPGRVYCSDKCRQDNYNAKRLHGHKPRVCARCGAEFTPANNTQRFCSAACRIKHNNGERPPRGADTGKTAQCVHCGKEFIMAANRKKYCSVECYAEGQRKRTAARRRREKMGG